MHPEPPTASPSGGAATAGAAVGTLGDQNLHREGNQYYFVAEDGARTNLEESQLREAIRAELEAAGDLTGEAGTTKFEELKDSFDEEIVREVRREILGSQP